MEIKYDWKQMGASISVDANAFPRTYGIVRRNGKVFYRNYKRPLKNGGLSFLDMYEKKRTAYYDNLVERLNQTVFIDAASV